MEEFFSEIDLDQIPVKNIKILSSPKTMGIRRVEESGVCLCLITIRHLPIFYTPLIIPME